MAPKPYLLRPEDILTWNSTLTSLKSHLFWIIHFASLGAANSDTYIPPLVYSTYKMYW